MNGSAKLDRSARLSHRNPRQYSAVHQLVRKGTHSTRCAVLGLVRGTHPPASTAARTGRGAHSARKRLSAQSLRSAATGTDCCEYPECTVVESGGAAHAKWMRRCGHVKRTLRCKRLQMDLVGRLHAVRRMACCIVPCSCRNGQPASSWRIRRRRAASASARAFSRSFAVAKGLGSMVRGWRHAAQCCRMG